MSRLRRNGLLALAACVGLILLASPAQGAFHLMKIREVKPGGASNSYVELQMWTGGQNAVSGHEITLYAANGTVADSFTMNSNVSQGGSQRTVLIAYVLCGALAWRPHLWLVSEAGGGKSWVLDNIVRPALRALALQVQSKTTEAGLRRTNAVTAPIAAPAASRPANLGTRLRATFVSSVRVRLRTRRVASRTRSFVGATAALTPPAA
jgi:hypothetical protein